MQDKFRKDGRRTFIGHAHEFAHILCIYQLAKIPLIFLLSILR